MTVFEPTKSTMASLNRDPKAHWLDYLAIVLASATQICVQYSACLNAENYAEYARIPTYVHSICSSAPTYTGMVPTLGEEISTRRSEMFSLID